MNVKIYKELKKTFKRASLSIQILWSFLKVFSPPLQSMKFILKSTSGSKALKIWN
jgi:hypothetical protein